MNKNELAKLNALEKAEFISNVVRAHLQGKPKVVIAKELDVSLGVVDAAISEWEDYIRDKAEQDSDILDRFLENIFKFDEEIRMISEETWRVVNEAQEYGAMGTKVQALRLAKDLMETKARLFQLMSPRIESGYIERTRKVEKVNAILSEIIRSTISGCKRCSDLAWARLEEAWKAQGMGELEA